MMNRHERRKLQQVTAADVRRQIALAVATDAQLASMSPEDREEAMLCREAAYAAGFTERPTCH